MVIKLYGKIGIPPIALNKMENNYPILTQFQKHILLENVGYDGQVKLQHSKVLIIGSGGLGCPVLKTIAACGIGHIGIVDFDRVEIHNLHRQQLYTNADVGKLKVDVAKDKLSAAYPFIKIDSVNQKLTTENATQFISNYDVVVDCTDNFTARYLINDTAVSLGKPIVYGSILNFEGQVSIFNLDGSKNLRDVFLEPPPKNETPNCDNNGVLGSLPNMIGTIMAHEVLKLILGLPTLTNQLLIIDTLAWEVKKVRY